MRKGGFPNGEVESFMNGLKCSPVLRSMFPLASAQYLRLKCNVLRLYLTERDLEDMKV